MSTQTEMNRYTEHQLRMLRLHASLGFDPEPILGFEPKGETGTADVTADTVSMPAWLYSTNPEYVRVRKGYAARYNRY